MKTLNEELNALRPGRLPINGSSAALKQLEGTEYVPSGFSDEGSINLLKQIDSVLQLAGWKRIEAFSKADAPN